MVILAMVVLVAMVEVFVWGRRGDGVGSCGCGGGDGCGGSIAVVLVVW
jgi:hypothetical protein